MLLAPPGLPRGVFFIEFSAVAFLGLARRAEPAAATAAMRIHDNGTIRRVYSTTGKQCGHDSQAKDDFHVFEWELKAALVYCQRSKQRRWIGNKLSALVRHVRVSAIA